MNHINELAREIYEVNVSKGFWPENPDDRNFGEAVALMHSEVTEAWEAYTNNWFDDKLTDVLGVEAELADVCIRILDYCGAFHFNIDAFWNSQAYLLAPQKFVIVDKYNFHTQLLECLMRINYYLTRAVESDRVKDKYICGTEMKFIYLVATLKLIFDWAADNWETNMMHIIGRKLEYNKTRKHKHGKTY